MRAGAVSKMVRTINFVAFGDSLTVGFIPSTFAERQPYSHFLKKLVDDFLERSGKKETIEVKIRNKGINGDLTSHMMLRFRRDVINLKPDYVIILGGANDIGWGISVEEILNNLKRMFNMATGKGIEPIGCTVPSILGWDEGIPPRLELNQSLKQFCQEKGILCVDLFAETCESETKRLRPDFSNDGLHLNASGYKKMADLIFEQSVKDILNRELNKG